MECGALFGVPADYVWAGLCVALGLRRNPPGAAAYRLPLGPIFAVIGIALMIVLFTRITREELVWILATGAVAFLNWLAMRRHVVAAAAAREL